MSVAVELINEFKLNITNMLDNKLGTNHYKNVDNLSLTDIYSIVTTVVNERNDLKDDLRRISEIIENSPH